MTFETVFLMKVSNRLFSESKENAKETTEKHEPVIEPNKPNYVYVNTAEEDSMVVQFVLAWRKGKRELIPDPPPQPVEEVKKEEPKETDAVVNETDEAKTDDVDKPIESSETELKKESEVSEDSKSDEQEANATEKADDVDGEKKADEKDAPAESESTADVTENVEQKESEKVEIEKPSNEQQPMETQESETKPESDETKMECEDKTSDQPEKVVDESAKTTDEPELSEKTDEQPMETEEIETKDEVKAETDTEIEKGKEMESVNETETEKEKEQENEKEEEKETKMDTETEIEAKAETDSETKAESASKDEAKEETATSDENAANVEKKDDEAKSDDDDDDESDKPEPVYIEVDEYYVKYRNFSYLHCEWRTEEELLKGDRRVSAKIRRFEVKKAQQMNIFENLEDEPFNPDFVETDRVLDMSVHEDPVTGKKTRHLLVKWKSLPYEDATWEIEDDVEEKKIEEYLRFSKVPPKDKWKPKRRPTPDMWRKLDETPVYKNNNTLRAYQLEGLNWLKFSWYNSHNCILADEMGLGKTVSLSKSNFAFFLHFQI